MAQRGWLAGRPIEVLVPFAPFLAARLPDATGAAIASAFTAIFAGPAWTAAAARAGLPLKPLVDAACRDTALGGEAALRALWIRRPWKEWQKISK